MKRIVTLLALAAAVAGCQQKPPAELVGKWEHVTDMGMMGKVAERLNLKPSGKFRLTRLESQANGQMGMPSGPNLTGGPETPDGEVIEGGKWTAKDGTLILSVSELYVGGVDVGPMQGGTTKVKYTVQGNTLSLDAKDLKISPPTPLPGQPAPPAPTTVAFNKIQ